MKKGEYVLKDLLLTEQDKVKSNGKILGKINGKEVVLKNGKFGMYVQIDGKNKSIKLEKKFENITLNDVKMVMKEKSSNILKKINENTDVRKGKYGPYVFHKTKDMKKPVFIPLKKTNIEDVNMDWVYDNM